MCVKIRSFEVCFLIHVGVWGKWEDRVTCFLALEKLAVCRRGKPGAWPACLPACLGL